MVGCSFGGGGGGLISDENILLSQPRLREFKGGFLNTHTIICCYLEFDSAAFWDVLLSNTFHVGLWRQESQGQIDNMCSTLSRHIKTSTVNTLSFKIKAPFTEISVTVFNGMKKLARSVV